MAMTGQDELILKNPDALLNGQALIEVVTSCAPAVHRPADLVANDIDAIMTAIRFATYDNGIETSINCPKCGSQNSFNLDLGFALDTMTFLSQDGYQIGLDNGLTLHLRPYKFPEIIKGLHSQFDQSRMIKAINNQSISEEERTSALGSALKNMSKTTFELTCCAVYKITSEDGTLSITDRQYIDEYLRNVEKPIIDKISNLIETMGAIGVNRQYSVTCSNCSNQWQAELDLNPVNFSSSL